METWAVVLQKLATPTVEQLTGAFLATGTLTRVDALTRHRDAYGILMEGLPESLAQALQTALAAEGVEAEVVPQAGIPLLPKGYALRRADLTAEALVWYDTMDRTRSLPWSQVIVIACGYVHITKSERNYLSLMQRTRPINVYHADIAPPSVEERVVEEDILLLDLLLGAEPWRLRLTANHFNYGCLGSRKTANAGFNFPLLVNDLLHAAPRALPNRGTLAFIRENADFYRYRSSQAFEDETRWLGWKLANAPDQGLR
jgi:hypothetical protein